MKVVVIVLHQIVDDGQGHYFFAAHLMGVEDNAARDRTLPMYSGPYDSETDAETLGRADVVASARQILEKGEWPT